LANVADVCAALADSSAIITSLCNVLQRIDSFITGKVCLF
jgi:hypothetical protein